jgi:hypothetical protein
MAKALTVNSHASNLPLTMRIICLSLLGATAASLDLIGLLLTGEWQDNSNGVAIGLFGVIVTAMISLLFRNLFSKEVRAWVWRKSARQLRKVPPLPINVAD